MFILYKQGKITKAQLDEFTHGVNYKKLPAKKKGGHTHEAIKRALGGHKK